jgi:archaellum biogenesis ATPase FlaH
MTNEPIIPRETEQAKLKANIAAGQPTLLFGDIGMGKTVLLKQMAYHVEVAIYVDTVSPIKSALLEILHGLHQRADLHLEGVGAEYLPWDDL